MSNNYMLLVILKKYIKWQSTCDSALHFIRVSFSLKRTMRVVIILMTAYLTVIITSKMMKLISTVDKFNYFKDF